MVQTSEGIDIASKDPVNDGRLSKRTKAIIWGTGATLALAGTVAGVVSANSGGAETKPNATPSDPNTVHETANATPSPTIPGVDIPNVDTTDSPEAIDGYPYDLEALKQMTPGEFLNQPIDARLAYCITSNPDYDLIMETWYKSSGAETDKPSVISPDSTPQELLISLNSWSKMVLSEHYNMDANGNAISKKYDLPREERMKMLACFGNGLSSQDELDSRLQEFEASNNFFDQSPGFIAYERAQGGLLFNVIDDYEEVGKTQTGAPVYNIDFHETGLDGTIYSYSQNVTTVSVQLPDGSTRYFATQIETP